jgi:uncharacterized membrane protein
MSIKKIISTFIFGGSLYYLAEVVFRLIVNHKSPHIIMFFIGGLSLLTILCIENYLKINLIIKAIIAGGCITLYELITGLVFKFILNNPLWAYGGINFLQIISLKWSLLWCLLALLIMLVARFYKKHAISK